MSRVVRSCAVAAATSAVAVVLATPSAGASSCLSGMWTPQQDLDAPIIFEGTTVEELPPEDEGIGVASRYIFEVDEVWKGDVPRRVTVNFPDGRAWTVPQSGLVVAGGRLDDELNGSGACGERIDANLRSAMVAANLEPRPPADEGMPRFVVAAGVLAVVGALVLAVVVRRRARVGSTD